MKLTRMSEGCMDSETTWCAMFERLRKPARCVSLVAIAVLLALAALFGNGCSSKAAANPAPATIKESPEMLPLDIAVVDESGKPVEGAEVEAHGLRTKKIRSGDWYRWRGEAQKAVTNAQGVARIQYPKYVEEQMETGKVDVLVSHKLFVVSRQEVSVDGSSKPVALLRGATVKVFGYVEREDQVVWPIHALLNYEGAQNWVPVEGPRKGLASSQYIHPGPQFLWLVHRTPEGSLLFSEALEFTAVKDGVHEFSLPLEPGVRLEGHLDANIPRPVKNGLAEVQVRPLKQDNSELRWTARTKTNEDGAFAFESLPKGYAEVAAWCDGGLTAYHPSGDTSSFVFPLPVNLPAGQTGIEIPMTRTSCATVRVEGPDGHPLDGAQVGFSPNIQWFRRFATLVIPSPLGSMEMLETDERKSRPSDTFMAVSNADGLATVSGLPPGYESFGVTHNAYEMPLNGTRRYGRIDLKPGETTAVTVRLQPKGTQVLGQ